MGQDNAGSLVVDVVDSSRSTLGYRVLYRVTCASADVANKVIQCGQTRGSSVMHDCARIAMVISIHSMDGRFSRAITDQPATSRDEMIDTYVSGTCLDMFSLEPPRK